MLVLRKHLGSEISSKDMWASGGEISVILGRVGSRILKVFWGPRANILFFCRARFQVIFVYQLCAEIGVLGAPQTGFPKIKFCKKQLFPGIEL